MQQDLFLGCTRAKIGLWIRARCFLMMKHTAQGGVSYETLMPFKDHPQVCPSDATLCSAPSSLLRDCQGPSSARLMGTQQ